MTAHVGSIPARAGETRPSPQPRRSRTVHPRACGGNQRDPAQRGKRAGPSPRVRGKRNTRGVCQLTTGSIPARAGETLCTPRNAVARRVHPRACGGNQFSRALLMPATGPSPRVRGKPAILKRITAEYRSIPARAGETCPCRTRSSRTWVHPRACGGNRAVGVFACLENGPSPRVRGKPGCADCGRRGSGSIPARAGETFRLPLPYTAPTVHPRACGGNRGAGVCARFRCGPSPRVRGKRAHPVKGGMPRGSIPARAGETPSSSTSRAS